MLLQLRCERDLVKVVKVIDELAQLLVLLTLPVHLVDGLVRGRAVALLRRLQEGQDERQAPRLAPLLHHERVVHL